MSIVQTAPKTIFINGRTLPLVTATHDPYQVKGTQGRVCLEMQHLDCQPVISPADLYSKRHEFFRNLFGRDE